MDFKHLKQRSQEDKAGLLRELIYKERFPRSSLYDPDWVIGHAGGPNALWCLEDLLTGTNFELKPGMRVLDMGCGRAMTSVFLAREFGVQVWATDLWFNPTDNWITICEAGVDHLVYPIQADGNKLPYAEGFFDAIVSVSAYHYFGGVRGYLSSVFIRLVKPGGLFGFVSPGFSKELDPADEKRLRLAWGDFDFITFHSAEWWRGLLSSEEACDVLVCETLKDGGQVWIDWEEVYVVAHDDFDNWQTKLLQNECGKTMTLVKAVVKRR
jgi:cyclopropane fatty-acyl-phospholipid synthase-like methyltransferase